MDHSHDLRPWQHAHVFDAGNRRGERRTHWVLVITLLTMAIEIVAGWWTGSMALLADGWHMGTHALALGVAAGAYYLARRHAGDTRYAFGTWKIEVLGGFASAMVLGLVGVGIVFESLGRLWKAEPIEAQAALIVAVSGLIVNIVSAWLLHGAQEGDEHAHHDHAHHKHEHRHEHEHAAHGGKDLNLRAAYAHVLADALTSVFAIAALSAALWLRWTWLDPLVGVIGAVVIAVWAWGLMRQSAAVLLDREMDHPLTQSVRTALESDGDAKVADLHLWRVGRESFAAVVCIVADAPLPPSVYRERLATYKELAHVSIEVNRCPHPPA
ncbi:MAG: CDF family Co(II)/Ni(II) efflux transporter DmeF [Rhizobacter sp.]